MAAAWLSDAQKVVHAVEAHQATRKPKRRPHLGPPASAAQLTWSIEAQEREGITSRLSQRRVVPNMFLRGQRP